MRAYEKTAALVFCLAIVVSTAVGQAIKQVTPEEATSHLQKKVEPKYPEVARKTHVQGDVRVMVTIAESGAVTGAKGVAGHPLLMPAAVAAVQQWHYRPFMVSGKAASVSTVAIVHFSLGPGAEFRTAYLQEDAECTKLLQSNKFAEAEPACKKALETANKLPESFESDKMTAYGNAGTVAYRLNKGAEALEDYKQQAKYAAVALKPDHPLWSFVHANLAHGHEATGDLPKADAEFKATEKVLEDTRASIEKTPVDGKGALRRKAIVMSYKKELQNTLQEHAELLKKMGQAAAAEQTEKRAKAIDLSQP